MPAQPASYNAHLQSVVHHCTGTKTRKALEAAPSTTHVHALQNAEFPLCRGRCFDHAISLTLSQARHECHARVNNRIDQGRDMPRNVWSQSVAPKKKQPNSKPM